MKYSKTSRLIKTRREEKGVTQNELAKKIGYAHAQFISNFERGYSPLPLKKLYKIRKILSIDEIKLEETLIEDFVIHIRGNIK